MSPIYRSTSLRGNTRKHSDNEVIIGRKSSPPQMKASRSSNNMLKPNQELNPFAPPQEAKESNNMNNQDTKFDNYINASYINSSEQLKLFIAAQAPKKHTTADFLQMIFENNVTLVTMLCEWKYKDKEQCYRYLGKQALNFGRESLIKNSSIDSNDNKFKTPDGLLQFTVDILETKSKFNQGLIIRKIKLTKRQFKEFDQDQLAQAGSADTSPLPRDRDFFNCSD